MSHPGYPHALVYKSPHVEQLRQLEAVIEQQAADYSRLCAELQTQRTKVIQLEAEIEQQRTDYACFVGIAVENAQQQELVIEALQRIVRQETGGK